MEPERTWAPLFLLDIFGKIWYYLFKIGVT
nr:MAG TPA: hypothetical protein [Caudoviricetes sp.]